MSRAKDLLKAGLDNKTGDAPDNIQIVEERQTPTKNLANLNQNLMDLESVLKVKQPRVDRAVKRTFEMRESHVDILDKVVKKAKANGRRITQSDALQFILSNWSEQFGRDLLK